MKADKKLGTLAVTVFKDLFPDAWKHDIKTIKAKCFDLKHTKQCSKCKKQWFVDDWPEREKCTIPDPMPITWDNAMMLFRAVFESDPTATAQALMEVYMSTDCGLHMLDSDANAKRTNAILWGLVHAEPKHLILAAIRAKEKEQA